MRLENISPDFEHFLAEISAGAISPADFEKLINLFETEITRVYFTESSEANLFRIIKGMYNKTFFIEDCLKYPQYIEIIILIAANSNYLTEILIINPEYFYWVVKSETLTNKLDKIKFKKELKSTISLYNSFQAKVHALKSLKRKELLRIGMRDTYLKIPVEDVTEELSILGTCLTDKMFEICYQEVLKKYGIKNPPGKYCIVALGKLGGSELNYSSDIDIILFYDKERKIKRQKYLSEILTEATQLFLKTSAEVTGGFLYRIDFRLRPDGRNSPLCRSLQEYMDYYESRGEDWERQMLIKAGFLSGSKSLYDEFINYILPFVFPKTFTISPKNQILKMKESIERRIRDEENIKLSYGGIRDIEFSIQALQLLNGGKFKNLRTGNTLTAINVLNQVDLLSDNEKKIFLDAYVFYRKIEHYLQLMNNRQTHLIPAEGEMLEKMSFYLGFKSTGSFKQRVNNSRKQVRKIYDSILSEDKNRDDSRNNLDDINFTDKSRAKNEFQFLREGKGIIGTRTFDSKSIENFQKIEEKIFNRIKNSNSPDIILSNFVRIIKQADFPSIWYNELLDETFFDLFMNVCEFSQYSVDLFAQDKELGEFFLSRKVFMKISFEKLSEFDLKYILLYLSVQLISQLLNASAVTFLMSKLLHKKIQKLVEKKTSKMKWNNDYFVAAQGSLGSSTITFFSDLDLIFIIRNSQNYLKIENQFQDILALLRSSLKPFTVDCRLRPEGKNSQLVWDISDSKQYFKKRARVWELQALTKISFISGNNRLFNSFINAAASSISRFDQKQIKYQLIEMHTRLVPQSTSTSFDFFNVKKSPGSLYDIEFIIQYLILGHPKLFKQSFGKMFRDQIILTEKTKLKKSDTEVLLNAFNFLKNIELLHQTIFNASSPKILLNEMKMNAISSQMNYQNTETFKEELRMHTNRVKNIFSKVFN